jgi:hypothetical protein
MRLNPYKNTITLTYRGQCLELCLPGWGFFPSKYGREIEFKFMLAIPKNTAELPQEL